MRPLAGADRHIRQDVIVAASGLFFKKGYDKVTTDTIAAKAKISKRTLYKHFSSKDEIFETVIKEEIASQILKLELKSSHFESIFDRIVEAADRLLEWLLTDRIANLERVALSQIIKSPAIASNLHEFGFQRSVNWLASILGAGNAAGEIQIDDPVFAAEQLVTLVVVAPMRQSALGLAPSHYDDAAKEKVRGKVRLFLDGCHPSAAAAEDIIG